MPMVIFGMGLTNWIRLLLICFWVPSIILQVTRIAPMLEWLWNEHVFWWTGLTIFTVLMFERRPKKESRPRKEEMLPH